MNAAFFAKPLKAVNESDLLNLIKNEVREGREIEFKEVLSLDQTDDKREFLADVCSFANASGGLIFYGISEAEGLAKGLTGIKASDIDALTLRIESSIRDGVSPRIPLIETHFVPIERGMHVVMICIPKSWIGPHMVTFKNSSRFYSRNSAGKNQLDVYEIRNAFVATEELAQRMRSFRADRISRLIAGEVPVPLIGDSLVMLSVCPLISFSPGYLCDVAALERDDELRLKLMPIQSRISFSQRFTFDGFMNYEHDYSSGKTLAYAEFIRSGCVEAVNATILTFNTNFPNLIFADRVETETIKALNAHFMLLKGFGIPSPAFVMFSLLNIKGFKIYSGPQFSGGTGGHAVEKDHLIVPEIYLDDYGADAADVLRPAFDSIFNACGYSRSWNYSEKGEWKPRK